MTDPFWVCIIMAAAHYGAASYAAMAASIREYQQ